MATQTVTQAVTTTITATGTPSSTFRAAPQGGILDHGNPVHYDVKNPLTLFIIQAGIIIILCRLLHYPLSRISQPRVIAEVIGGILLGPSAFGRIPGFTDAIFPPASMPALNNAASLGLILFLFLVGLEVDVRFLLSNWRVAMSVGALGMVLPFGLGCAIAYGIYNQFVINEPGTVPIAFGTFILFVGVAMAITAFPVLCRILTELKLLSTPVGIIVLSAGVSNDVVGWILLALCVALVNAGSGITSLYVLLTAFGFTMVLIYGIRPIFLWMLRRTGSLQNGPSQGVMAITMLLVLACSFFTSIIGIHPIFGAFLMGVICPHDGGFAIKVTEKIEDLVAVVFLPLYFALSGLSTNLGLLNNGLAWAYVIAIIAVAFFAKVIGGTIAAKLCGMVWRESLSIGVLMSCKGLVELIVLNIGLQAKILSTRTFTMFVVMALLTTFATTPLIKWLYPRWYQVKIAAWKRGEIDWDSGQKVGTEASGLEEIKADDNEVHRMLAYLRLDTMSGVMAVISLLARPVPDQAPRRHPALAAEENLKGIATPTDEDDPLSTPERPLQVYGVRLTQLTDRESSVMRVSELDEASARDPVVNAFRTFGQVKSVAIAGQLAIATEPNYASTLSERAQEAKADFMLLGWSASGAIAEHTGPIPVSARDRFVNGGFSSFMLESMDNAPCPVAVFVDRGFGSRQNKGGTATGSESPGPVRPRLHRTVSALSAHSAWTTPLTLATVPKGHHIFFPFFGSPDDAAALRIVLQMAQDPTVTATIIRYELNSSMEAAAIEAVKAAETSSSAPEVSDAVKTTLSPTTPKTPKTPKSPKSPTTEDAASTTQNEDEAISSSRPASPHSTAAVDDPATIPPSRWATIFEAARSSLSEDLRSRITFSATQASSRPLQDLVERANEEVGRSSRGAGDLVIVGRNIALGKGLGRKEGADSKAWGDSEAGKALGVLAGGVVRGVPRASVMVVREIE